MAAGLLPDEFHVSASDSPFDGTLHHLESGPSFVYTAGFTWYLTPRVVDVRSLPTPEAPVEPEWHPWDVRQFWEEPRAAPSLPTPEEGFRLMHLIYAALVLIVGGGTAEGVRRRRRRNGHETQT